MPYRSRKSKSLVGEIWSAAVTLTVLWILMVGLNSTALFDSSAIKLPAFGTTTKEQTQLLYWGFTALTIITWVAVGVALVARRNRRRREIEQTRSISQMQALAPERFEELVAEIFIQKGYGATVTPMQGDHGVDVVLRAPNGEKEIVQCKRYQGQVGEPIVRDFFGAMLHENAVCGYIVTTGEFTQQAKSWARGKPIELIDGHRLNQMRQSQPMTPVSVVTAPVPTGTVPVCPRCGSPMVLRTARRGNRAGKSFYGCSTYPRCNGIVNVD
jgi:restriction system protein